MKPNDKPLTTDPQVYMGTLEEAEAKLLDLTRQWRELRQPRIVDKKTHDRIDIQERELRFQIANAACLFLWHKENPNA